MITMNQKLRGSLSLLIATLIGGSTFVAQSVGMDYIEALLAEEVEETEKAFHYAER